MSHTPPINRRELGKQGVFDENVFYNEVAEACGYIDPEMAQRFYLGMVKAITKTLRTKGVVRLPHLGDLALVEQKPRSMLAGTTRVVREGLRLIKFYPNETWKKYFVMKEAQK